MARIAMYWGVFMEKKGKVSKVESARIRGRTHLGPPSDLAIDLCTEPSDRLLVRTLSLSTVENDDATSQSSRSTPWWVFCGETCSI